MFHAGQLFIFTVISELSCRTISYRDKSAHNEIRDFYAHMVLTYERRFARCFCRYFLHNQKHTAPKPERYSKARLYRMCLIFSAAAVCDDARRSCKDPAAVCKDHNMGHSMDHMVYSCCPHLYRRTQRRSSPVCQTA